MRAFCAKVFPATALVLALTMPGLAVPRPKEPQPQTPLELKIFGPGFIYPSQRQVRYKAVLTNRSSEPVVIAARDARLDFTLTSTISDSSGRELGRTPLLYCPVGGKGWYQNLVRHMKDSDVAILKPGEKFEFLFDDISSNYIFPGRGRYHAAIAYSYVPPQFEGNAGSPVDGFDAKYDLSELSPATLENLRHAVPISVGATATMILQ